MSAPATRRLVIVSSEPVYWGRSKRGDNFTIFEVTATTADGQPIGVPLRSFSDLPLGEREFEVSLYTGKDGSTSYTLTPRKPPPAQAALFGPDRAAA